MDVRFPEGGERPFWPRDLEEVSPAPPSWWRSLLKGIAKRCTKKATSWKTYTYGQREPVVQPATLEQFSKKMVPPVETRRVLSLLY